MRPEQDQISMLIVLSTAQRFVRSANMNGSFRDRTPLPIEASSSISRRRISKTLTIPLETVRRNVISLLECGLIIERRRGSLSTPGGTLAQLAEKGLPERIARRFLSVSTMLTRLGAAQPNPDDRAHRARPTLPAR